MDSDKELDLLQQWMKSYIDFLCRTERERMSTRNAYYHAGILLGYDYEKKVFPNFEGYKKWHMPLTIDPPVLEMKNHLPDSFEALMYFSFGIPLVYHSNLNQKPNENSRSKRND